MLIKIGIRWIDYRYCKHLNFFRRRQDVPFVVLDHIYTLMWCSSSTETKYIVQKEGNIGGKRNERIDTRQMSSVLFHGQCWRNVCSFNCLASLNSAIRNAQHKKRVMKHDIGDLAMSRFTSSFDAMNAWVSIEWLHSIQPCMKLNTKRVVKQDIADKSARGDTQLIILHMIRIHYHSSYNQRRLLTVAHIATTIWRRCTEVDQWSIWT